MEYSGSDRSFFYAVGQLFFVLLARGDISCRVLLSGAEGG